MNRRQPFLDRKYTKSCWNWHLQTCLFCFSPFIGSFTLCNRFTQLPMHFKVTLGKRVQSFMVLSCVKIPFKATFILGDLNKDSRLQTSVHDYIMWQIIRYPSNSQFGFYGVGLYEVLILIQSISCSRWQQSVLFLGWVWFQTNMLNH